jgi:glycogen debranching enzyme
MAERGLIILDGCTFFYSDPNGDVEAKEAEGYFFHDVRHLSRWLLRVDGRSVEPLTSRRVDYYSARIVGTRKGDDDAPPLAIRRDRFVTDGVHEDLVLANTSAGERRVRLELSFGADFADVMEARDGPGNNGGRRWVDVGTRSATLWFEREGYRRGTVITFRRAPRRLTSNRAVFDVRLRPRQEWSMCIDVIPIVDGSRRKPLTTCGGFGDPSPKMPKRPDRWLLEAPRLEADRDSIRRTYCQSLLDLAALRIRPDEAQIHWATPGGGLPWFMTIFGRDSLIASYEALPFHHDLVEATLEALAHLQATELDDFRDAEPGKIPHELRRGTLAKLGKVPHSPYYGTHDATLLWLILLDEYERWTGDVSLVRRHEGTARAALEWMEGPADPDRDGYLEYRKRSSSDHALDNHCWKDSDDSIRFADGRKAKPPIATCEIQGYAFDARLRTARLAREIWEDDKLAERLEREADELKERFNRDFWSTSRRHYVLALDGDKQQVDSMTSNVGHLLWSGIVDDRRASATVRRLLRDDMFSGWGIRSMSARDRGFNPLEYHTGTVWPHDSAIVAEGMRRYGFHAEAGRVCEALLDAADAFASRLPEVFAGFARDKAEMPVEYPDALKPQAWAAGAPLLGLRTLLGLDVVKGKLRARPHVPSGLGRLRLRGIEVRGRRVDAP